MEPDVNNETKIEIKPLAPALADDYFDFFDNRAFSDHTEWSYCYCTFFHVDQDEIEKAVQADGGADALRCVIRGAAERFVMENVLHGYLAYVDGVPIGWCNADRKASYRKFCYDAEVSSFIRGASGDDTKCITCFTIAPEYRGKGVASALLERVCEDARSEGYAAVEGYPRLHDQFEPFDFYGPVRLYEKVGFVKAAEWKQTVVMRKVL
jgi:GNAT superfamily N-acetyltransferase